MDMPNREFITLYHAAWKKSVDDAKAAEAAQRAQEEEAKRQSKGRRSMTARERIDAVNRAQLAGVTSGDLEDFMDEIS